jgi:hypothetical protein
VRGGDQTVEVAGLAHGRSIGRAPLPGNKTRAAFACALVLWAGAAAAADVSVDGYVDGLAIIDTAGGRRQRPQAVGVARFDGNAARWLRGHLELRGRIGGPFEGGQGIGVYEYDQMFQNRSPAFDVVEGWVEFRARRAELRAGIQRVAWGRLDGIPPTDVVNPRDWHDPFVDEPEERKFGIPMLLGTTSLPDVAALSMKSLKLQLLYVPIAVPPRLALAEERWFPSSIGLADGGIPIGKRVPVTLPTGQVVKIALPNVAVDFGTQNDTPARTLENGGIGGRLSASVRRVDWSLYHYTGPETNPDASLPVWVRARNPYTGGLSTPDELLAFLAALPGTRPIALSRLTQEHDSIHMTGVDFATTLGDATIRGEAAWFIDRPYLRNTRSLLTPERLIRAASGKPCPLLRNLQAGRCPLFTGPQVPVDIGNIYPDLDTVEWGLGVDYLWNGFQPILQVNQIVFLEDTPDLLVGSPTDTRFLGALRKRVLEDRVELEFRGVYMVEKSGWFAFPRISWDVRDDLRVRLGYLVIGGSKNSLIGQYKGNDEVVLQARWSF